MEVVKLLHKGRNEILNIINRDGEMMQYFTDLRRAPRMCPLIDASYEKVPLGKGVQGEVFALTDSQGESKEYVVKVADSGLYKLVSTPYSGPTTTLKKIAKKVELSRKIDRSAFLAINGGLNKKIEEGSIYIDVFPRYESGYNSDGLKCKIQHSVSVHKFFWDVEENPGNSEPVVYKRVYVDEYFTYPKGSYLCSLVTQPEYVILLLCADLYNSGRCMNFIDVFGFSTCPVLKKEPHVGSSDHRLKDYIFMQRIDGDLEGLAKSNLTDTQRGIIGDSIIGQILFSVAIMNRLLGVYHHDLHMKNIFLVKSWKHASLDERGISNKVKYVSYHVDGTKVYIPFAGYVVKIGDYGFATKFSNPVIGSKEHTIQSKYEMIPRWRDDAYDTMYSSLVIYILFGKYSKICCRVMIRILFDNSDVILGEFKDDVTKMRDLIEKRLADGYWYDMNYNRPTLRPNPVRPWLLLTDPLVMGEYLQVPPPARTRGGIPVFGKLEGWFEGYHDYNPENDSKSATDNLISREKRSVIPRGAVTQTRERELVLKWMHDTLKESMSDELAFLYFLKAVNIYDRYTYLEKDPVTKDQRYTKDNVILELSLRNTKYESLLDDMSKPEERKNVRKMMRKIESVLGYETDPVTIYDFTKEFSRSIKVSKSFFGFVENTALNLINNPQVLYSRRPSFFALSFFYLTPKYRDTALKFMSELGYSPADFSAVKEK